MTDITSQSELINVLIGCWEENGYRNPPTPDCATIPPLGERSAEAVAYGHRAIKEIDTLLAELHKLRGTLVNELRQNDEIRNGHLYQAYRDEQTAAAVKGNNE